MTTKSSPDFRFISAREQFVWPSSISVLLDFIIYQNPSFRNYITSSRKPFNNQENNKQQSPKFFTIPVWLVIKDSCWCWWGRNKNISWRVLLKVVRLSKAPAFFSLLLNFTKIPFSKLSSPPTTTPHRDGFWLFQIFVHLDSTKDLSCWAHSQNHSGFIFYSTT